MKSNLLCGITNDHLGKNKYGVFLSQARSILGITYEVSISRSKIANHSARKTRITNLLNNNIHTVYVTQLSGHKNTESLNHYYVCSKERQRKIANILNPGPSNKEDDVKQPSSTKTASAPREGHS